MPLQRARHHVIDEAMFVGQAFRGVLVLEFGFEDLGEDILEFAVVRLENRILGGQIHRQVTLQPVTEACPRESADGFGHVVLHLRNAGTRVIEDHMLNRLAAIVRSESHRETSGAIDLEIGRLVLVAERMTGDDDRLGPAGNEPRDVGNHNRLAEDGAAEDVADGTVGGLPHLLQTEFLDPGLVRGDGCAFDANMFTLDGVGRVDGHLVVSGVPVLDAQIVVFQVDVEIGENQTILDILPDHAGHFVSVELDDLAFDLNLGHELPSSRGCEGYAISNSYRKPITNV